MHSLSTFDFTLKVNTPNFLIYLGRRLVQRRWSFAVNNSQKIDGCKET